VSILGLDPSTKSTGWGLLTNEGELIAFGYLAPVNCPTNQKKLANIYDGVRTLIELYHPTEVVCENQFLGKRVETIKTLSQLRGVIMLACEQENIEIIYYWPASIKKAVTGKGNASKAEMIKAICERFKLDDINDDTADALGVAYTHSTSPGRVGPSKKK
jgi:crossover junction endodeoxyribonuclease RuvC